jgi:hypothetical protein
MDNFIPQFPVENFPVGYFYLFNKISKGNNTSKDNLEMG